MAETDKTYDATVDVRSVVSAPTVQERQQPSAHPILLTVAALSQAITPWGVNPKRRDKELRAFWPTEPWLASVVYSVAIRNASFAWEITAADQSRVVPKNTANAVKRLLHHSDRGKGWKSLLIKTCVDILTTDNGGWWEIIRTEDRPDAPVLNLAHLDSLRIQRTGDAEFPAIYTDRYGRETVMRWWQVRSLEEMPSPIEQAFGLAYSAVTRCLLAAEIIQSISVYKQEKISGTFSRAIDIVSGVTQQNIEEAIAIAQEQQFNRQLYRYSVPVIIPGVDPTSTLSHVHINLAALPDNFDEDASLRWYVAQLAAAFGVDYQEIAPLMSGNLGSSQQSEIMHLKTRGKGPALFMGLIEDVINGGLIPQNVAFRFLEQDVRSEAEKAEARFTRAKDRAMRIKAGELDGKAARWIAVKDGDLPEWMAIEIDEREVLRKAKEPTEEIFEDEISEGEVSPDQIIGGIESNETV